MTSARQPVSVLAAVVIYVTHGNLAAARNLLANQPPGGWRDRLLAAGVDRAIVEQIVREDE